MDDSTRAWRNWVTFNWWRHRGIESRINLCCNLHGSLFQLTSMTLWVYRGASTTNVEGNHASTLWAVLSPEFSGIARNLWGGLLIINVVVIFVKNGKCCISTLKIVSLCRWGFNLWNPPIGYATAWVCYAWSTWLHYENTWLLWWSGRMHKTSILDSRNQLSLSQQCQTIILVDLYMKNYEVQFLWNVITLPSGIEWIV